MNSTKALLPRAAAFLGLWIVLTGLQATDVLVGILVALLAAWTSVQLVPPGQGQPNALALMGYGLRLVQQSIVAGFDVAWRALQPQMQLKPGFISYRSHLPPGHTRNVFCTVMGLAPGTLASGTGEDGALVIHCLDTDQPVAEQLAIEEGLLVNALGARQTDD